MLPSPTISVILSAYNSQATIAEAIESILQQTYVNFEFIIINDGSTDDTQSIIEQSARQDTRIIPVINKENIGLTRSLNKGLQIARGEFIARMDADDISLPDRFKKQIAFFSQHPEIGLLGGHIQYIDSQGGFLKPGPNLPTTDFFIRWRLLFRNSFIHSTVLFRRSCLENAGIYNEQYKYAQDYEFWSRISQISQCANLPHILVNQRISEQAITTQNYAQQDHFAVRIACNNTNALLAEKIITESQMVKLRQWFVHGAGSIQSAEDVTTLINWITVYHNFIHQYQNASLKEKHILKKWFSEKVLSYNQNIRKVPQLYEFINPKTFLVQFLKEMKNNIAKWIKRNR